MVFDSNPPAATPDEERNVAPEEEPVTSRDEAGEPSGEEDAANEEEGLRDKEEASEEPSEEPENYLELAQRIQADFENYRKRAAREAAVAGERAKSGLVRELLPIVDNLERALMSAEEGEQHLAEGVRLVHSELIAVLERNGVQQFDPAGDRFDPAEHEALSVREDGEPGLAHRERLVFGGIEPVAGGVELLDAVPLEHGDQLGVHEPHSLRKVLLTVLRGGECPFEVVDDGKQLADESALCPLTRGGRLTRGALPIVLEIRLNALGKLQVLVARLLGRRLLLVAERLLFVGGVLLAGGLTRLVT